MNIEENIFKRNKIDFSSLSCYGFSATPKGWQYTKTIMNGAFRAVIDIDKRGTVTGDVYEADSEDVYLPLRIESMVAGFAGEVRQAYEDILIDIKAHCCHKNYFITPQANRITHYIHQQYGDSPSFPWKKFSGYGIFRNPHNNKWYALIANLDKNKLDKKQSGEIEIINIKLAETKIQELLKQKGFYPAYHMNKKTWITILLDDTLSDNTIFKLLHESYKLIQTKKHLSANGHTEWLIPANPQYFNIDEAFKKQKEIIWKQSTSIKENDIIYMYVGSPVSAIRYKCIVKETDIPYSYADKNLKINKVMKIARLKTYPADFMPFNKLKTYGVNAIRGPRSCPIELIKILNAYR